MAVAMTRASRDEYPELIEIWEASVRATHDFVAEDDIRSFRPLILGTYFGLVDLWCARSETDGIVGFVGVAEGKIEMLFVSPAHFGEGIGKLLLRHAVHSFGATLVDVNEQNTGAVGFYEHHGFATFDRSPLDGTGKPYPLLHMRLASRRDANPNDPEAR